MNRSFAGLLVGLHSLTIMDVTLLEIWNRLQSGTGGELLRRQTTFIEIALHEARYRVHFRETREVSIHRGAFSSFAVSDEHPLLLDYVEPQAVLYFGAPPDDPESLTTDLRTAAESLFAGWRDVGRYANRLMPLPELLRTGGGLLLEGPESFIRSAQAVAEEHGMRPTLDVRRTPEKRPSILLLDRSFVIAERFWAEALP